MRIRREELCVMFRHVCERFAQIAMSRSRRAHATAHMTSGARGEASAACLCDAEAHSDAGGFKNSGADGGSPPPHVFSLRSSQCCDIGTCFQLSQKEDGVSRLNFRVGNARTRFSRTIKGGGEKMSGITNKGRPWLSVSF